MRTHPVACPRKDLRRKTLDRACTVPLDFFRQVLSPLYPVPSPPDRPPRSFCLRPGESTTFLIGYFPGGGYYPGWFDFFFQCASFYYRSSHGHLPPLPPSWSLRDFFLTLIEGFVLFIHGLPLSSDFWNGVHSVDESVISPRTRDVDLFTSIARVFLDSPSLPPCS